MNISTSLIQCCDIAIVFALKRIYSTVPAAETKCELKSLIHLTKKMHYITLLETIFCRVKLLNRRRPGELQRLTLDAYQNCDTNAQNYEEFSKAVSPSEKNSAAEIKTTGNSW